MQSEINIFDNVLEYLSQNIRTMLSFIPNEAKSRVEEIRLRNGCPLSIYLDGKDYFVTLDNHLTENISHGYIVQKEDINNSFQLITNHSIYAFSEDIRKGYITITGGHRVGIGGKVIYDNSGIEMISSISSLNVRIARQKKGISDHIIPFLLDENKNIYNTLIISPPQCGKTTLLRDLIRNLSNGDSQFRRGFKVSLIDERSEIAGLYNGTPQMEVGVRTDVLDGCLKSDGIMIVIRALSPDIIAVDEIGGSEDTTAIYEALRAGIKLIATIHGSGLGDIRHRLNLNRLIDEKIFQRFIILDRSRGVGTIRNILEGDSFRDIYKRKRSLDGYY
ncbi:MAG: stage III sporulation protein AA [Tissierellaceae bacterium]|nr:stage III sporulation protein AA [Tissierellaceae bacterium]